MVTNHKLSKDKTEKKDLSKRGTEKKTVIRLVYNKYDMHKSMVDCTQILMIDIKW